MEYHKYYSSRFHSQYLLLVPIAIEGFRSEVVCALCSAKATKHALKFNIISSFIQTSEHHLQKKRFINKPPQEQTGHEEKL